ncbi:carbohydrate kinase [Arthrobacter sp. JZ12]|uniref:PfkB family carbohydrate kinase n=1 Tax=Arthrobacter sp. JZ12 TaxID=2654190 RepID=UPI002B485F46|nr:PfkB family carbohydrate kinase [Arthrobacter sp. JZ12]WRH25159.1 carbohydrate kinase [Arthrobacter sp. JZ12]
MGRVVVVGQVARDLVLQIDRMPDEGGSTPVLNRRELLGGKGANQAVACVQLGADVELIGVVGEDYAGQEVLREAAANGIGIDGVVRRSGAPTALLVDVVEPHGVRRLLEDVDDRVLLSEQDIRHSEARLKSAAAVLVQLQQPQAALLAALDAAAAGAALVVADGAPSDEDTRRQVLDHADVVRADAAETEALVGWQPQDLDQTIDAARTLLAEGPDIVALAVPTGGNVVAWHEGHVELPFLEEDEVDPTGAGDAFIAALTVALLEGEEPVAAAWWAAVAASRVVTTIGGRPDLSLSSVREQAHQARKDS